MPASSMGASTSDLDIADDLELAHNVAQRRVRVEWRAGRLSSGSRHNRNRGQTRFSSLTPITNLSYEWDYGQATLTVFLPIVSLQ